jgi:hypothetical protein
VIAVLHGFVAWLLILRAKHKLKTVGKEILRRMGREQEEHG